MMEKTNEISCVHPFAISDHAFQTLKASIVDRKLSHKDLNEFKFQSRKQVTDIARLIEANNEFGAKKVKEVSIGKRQSHLVSYGCENYDSATYSCSFRRSAEQTEINPRNCEQTVIFSLFYNKIYSKSINLTYSV